MRVLVDRIENHDGSIIFDVPPIASSFVDTQKFRTNFRQSPGSGRLIVSGSLRKREGTLEVRFTDIGEGEDLDRYRDDIRSLVSNMGIGKVWLTNGRYAEAIPSEMPRSERRPIQRRNQPVRANFILLSAWKEPGIKSYQFTPGGANGSGGGGNKKSTVIVDNRGTEVAYPNIKIRENTREYYLVSGRTKYGPNTVPNIDIELSSLAETNNAKVVDRPYKELYSVDVADSTISISGNGYRVKAKIAIWGKGTIKLGGVSVNVNNDSMFNSPRRWKTVEVEANDPTSIQFIRTGTEFVIGDIQFEITGYATGIRYGLIDVTGIHTTSQGTIVMGIKVPTANGTYTLFNNQAGLTLQIQINNNQYRLLWNGRAGSYNSRENYLVVAASRQGSTFRTWTKDEIATGSGSVLSSITLGRILWANSGEVLWTALGSGAISSNTDLSLVSAINPRLSDFPKELDIKRINTDVARSTTVNDIKVSLENKTTENVIAIDSFIEEDETLIINSKGPGESVRIGDVSVFGSTSRNKKELFKLDPGINIIDIIYSNNSSVELTFEFEESWS